MSEDLPVAERIEMQFENGTALGTSQRWEGGQYCSIMTRAGIVGCGVYDLESAKRFDQAIAIARGTPESPLVFPQDLLDAKIVEASPRAIKFGIHEGMSGREAVERMLCASTRPTQA